MVFRTFPRAPASLLTRQLRIDKPLLLLYSLLFSKSRFSGTSNEVENEIISPKSPLLYPNVAMDFAADYNIYNLYLATSRQKGRHLHKSFGYQNFVSLRSLNDSQVIMANDSRLSEREQICCLRLLSTKTSETAANEPLVIFQFIQSTLLQCFIKPFRNKELCYTKRRGVFVDGNERCARRASTHTDTHTHTRTTDKNTRGVKFSSDIRWTLPSKLLYDSSLFIVVFTSFSISFGRYIFFFFCRVYYTSLSPIY